MLHGLAGATTIVFLVGSSLIGTLGSGSEWVAKEINKNDHPILGNLADLFAKTLQTSAAAFSLVIIGSLFVNPIGLNILLTIGSAMVLTPFVHAAMKNSNNLSLKTAVAKVDHAVNITSKLTNSAVLTMGVYLALGIPAAILASISLGALSVKLLS